MDLVADDDPGSVEELAPYAEGGRAFVAADASDRPVGYLLLDVVDGAAHIEQVSVHPLHARQRIGRALIERAVTWARHRGLDALTLTTYVEVPGTVPTASSSAFNTSRPRRKRPNSARFATASARQASMPGHAPA